MNNISESNLVKLNEQQTRIIESTEKYIVVHAGPGSGKTYTLVRMIAKKMNEIESHKSIIACSFTREASKQLRDKIESQCDYRNSFVGTIDSFIFSEIFSGFYNRFLKSMNLPTWCGSLTVVFPSNDSDSFKLTKQGLSNSNKSHLNAYSKIWLQKLTKGIYEISFPTYGFGVKLLRQNKQLIKYLSSKYDTIYIDEAQDMNDFQHNFIKELKDTCNLSVILIGDRNQSIYEFRGSRPELFYNLKNDGYKPYEITYSVRCHKSILDFSNLLIDENFEYEENKDNRVNLNISPTIEKISELSGNFFVLCETNKTTEIIYEYLIEADIPVILTKRIILNDNNFSNDYLDIIEEILKFFINLSNKPKFVYSISDYSFFIEEATNAFIKESILIPLRGEKLIAYLFRILEILNVYLTDNIMNEIETQLKDIRVINHYKNLENVNRILTIHSSKGLEADNIFVVLDTVSKYYYNDEYRRKLFVAFTRARNNLFISKTKEARVSKQVYDYKFEEILDLIIK